MNMSGRYEHTQIGYLIIVALGIAVLGLAYHLAAYGFNWISLAVLIVLAAGLVSFATLTVEIYQEVLEVRFGPGFVRKRFLLKDIESCQVVKNPWYYGWGIRVIPHAWLYNVSGSLAVEFKMKSGKRYRVGTDDPRELAKAISQSIGQLTR